MEKPQRHRTVSKMYILFIDTKILAMSESVNDIYHYIEQFKEYFINHNDYKIIFEDISRGKLCNQYMEYYLHYWNSDIILTDREISYYSELFHKMYEDTKTMISQCMLNNSIMKLSMEEKTLNTRLFETLHSKVYSYQSFLDSLDSEVILKKYIVNPLVIKDEFY